MKRLAILIVLALLAGGSGGWSLMSGGGVAQGAEHKPAAEDDGSAVPKERFVEIDPIVLPILRKGKVAWHMTFVVVFELNEPLGVDEIRYSMPRLRDAVLSELHSLFAFRYIQERGTLTPGVKTRLKRTGERVFGAGAVHAVFVQEAGKRPLHST